MDSQTMFTSDETVTDLMIALGWRNVRVKIEGVPDLRAVVIATRDPARFARTLEAKQRTKVVALDPKTSRTVAPGNTKVINQGAIYGQVIGNFGHLTMDFTRPSVPEPPLEVSILIPPHVNLDLYDVLYHEIDRTTITGKIEIQ